MEPYLSATNMPSDINRRQLLGGIATLAIGGGVYLTRSDEDERDSNAYGVGKFGFGPYPNGSGGRGVFPQANRGA